MIMWSGYNKIWSHYPGSILAADADSADFLGFYLRYIRIKRSYVHSMEVIDLQKYKVHKTPRKVRQAINDRLDIPFVFLHSCN